MVSNSTIAQVSAYRFHVADPLVFTNGFKYVWRNGDMNDPATGLKCTLQSGGNTNGNPKAADTQIYSWFYTW